MTTLTSAVSGMAIPTPTTVLPFPKSLCQTPSQAIEAGTMLGFGLIIAAWLVLALRWPIYGEAVRHVWRAL